MIRVCHPASYEVVLDRSQASMKQRSRIRNGRLRGRRRAFRVWHEEILIGTMTFLKLVCRVSFLIKTMALAADEWSKSRRNEQKGSEKCKLIQARNPILL